jgi:hypothetical protein
MDPAPELSFVGGAGGLTCGIFMAQQSQNNAAQKELFVQWVQGYIVAYDMRSNFGKQSKRAADGNVSEFVDGPAILRFLESHCIQHPLDTVMDGTIALINGMGGKIAWKADRK